MSKKQRQEFIQRTLDAQGYINREDLKQSFGVSDSQAANDFALFLAANPDAMIYNHQTRRYERT